MENSLLYVVDSGKPTFEASRSNVAVVCAGDSITGWNNFGLPSDWPYPTYPQFLQELCEPLGLLIANGGIAGEISANGVGQVRDYLVLFPHARYFIIGYGTNDLGTWPDLRGTSEQIINNLGRMAAAVREQGKRAILFNVPYANESYFPPQVALDTHQRRDYHNLRLEEYCDEKEIPLVDICSRLRDRHFGDELHPNETGAKIIAEEVFRLLKAVQTANP